MDCSANPIPSRAAKGGGLLKEQPFHRKSLQSSFKAHGGSHRTLANAERQGRGMLFTSPALA